jgi:hypothetical protein
MKHRLTLLAFLPLCLSALVRAEQTPAAEDAASAAVVSCPAPDGESIFSQIILLEEMA